LKLQALILSFCFLIYIGETTRIPVCTDKQETACTKVSNEGMCCHKKAQPQQCPSQPKEKKAADCLDCPLCTVTTFTFTYQPPIVAFFFSQTKYPDHQNQILSDYNAELLKPPNA
jgi:hypothetical protein